MKSPDFTVKKVNYFTTFKTDATEARKSMKYKMKIQPHKLSAGKFNH